MNYKKLFNLAQEKGITDLELYISKNRKLAISMYHKNVESYNVSDNEVMSARGIYNGKMGYVFCEKLTNDSFDFIIDSIIKNANIIEENKKVDIFAGSEKYRKYKTYNDSFDLVPASEKIKKMIETEDFAAKLREDMELIQGGSNPFDEEAFLNGDLTPVFFGTALGNFGVDCMLDGLTAWAPSPLDREADSRKVQATEEKLSGFIFKIQANMDPKHRDRIAFMRLVSGRYHKGMKLRHVRIERDVQISDAVTFMAGEREMALSAVAGDIIGIHNHGTIRIGDTFTEGEILHFSGIPNFAPELFRRIRLKDPLKQKQLLKGLVQLSEEGAVQVFRPIVSNDLIVGAVGVLQFDVVVSRLKHEYNVDAVYENVNVSTARWVSSDDPKALEELEKKVPQNLAYDGGDNLTYLASSGVNLSLTMERHPKVHFAATREH